MTSVIDEECGRNGMRAMLDAGYVGDGTLTVEPTDLRVHHSGVGVIWACLRFAAPAATPPLAARRLRRQITCPTASSCASTATR